MLSSVDIVSFDVFDTLLLRRVGRPEDVFGIVEKNLSCLGFSKARQRAERCAAKTRSGACGDVRLADIYAELKNFSSCQTAELACEEAVLVRNEAMFSLWQRAVTLGKRIVVTSDMYLPQSFIKKVLEREGFVGAEKMFISSEEGCRKSTGKLFLRILDYLNVSPDRIIHIGDNTRSDYRMPRRIGIKAFLYLSPQNSFIREHLYGKRFLDRSNDCESRRYFANLIGLWSFRREQEECPTYWESIGFLFGGPLVAGFSSWIHGLIKTNGISRVLFVARDGWVLERVFKSVYNDIATQYVYAPRTVSAFVLGHGGVDADVNGEKSAVRSLIGPSGESAVAEYQDYVQGLQLQSEVTGVVDGVSKSLSAQRLLEKCSGVRLHGYYADIIGDGISGIAANAWGRLSQTFFVEQLLSSVEYPIMGVRRGRPLYQQMIDPHETMACNVYRQIAKGIEDCATLWLTRGYQAPTPEIWSRWADAFANNPDAEDIRQFQNIRHASNILHTQYKLVFQTWSRNPIWRMILKMKQLLFETGALTLSREHLNGYLIRKVRLHGICVFSVKKKEC